jgi:putative Mg2+ transporter-C (MgtC) family protein
MTSTLDLALRLLLATVIGALIGLNRNSHGKPAGLRTHALVALGSALIVAVCGGLPGADSLHSAEEQSRAIQGLITGVGFLGAGVILHSSGEKRIHGLTTAAAIWIAALLGAGCGTGAFTPVLIASALLCLILGYGGSLERALHRRLHPGDPDPGAPSE